MIYKSIKSKRNLFQFFISLVLSMCIFFLLSLVISRNNNKDNEKIEINIVKIKRENVDNKISVPNSYKAAKEVDPQTVEKIMENSHKDKSTNADIKKDITKEEDKTIKINSTQTSPSNIKGTSSRGKEISPSGDTNGGSKGNGLDGKAGFIKGSDGYYVGNHNTVVNFTILKEAKPKYPKQARDIEYNKTVVAEALILVGLSGNVEKVEILNTLPNLGFKEEAIKALMEMKYAPIYVNGINVKKYFKRKLYFQK